jgi:hypothetical protein
MQKYFFSTVKNRVLSKKKPVWAKRNGYFCVQIAGFGNVVFTAYKVISSFLYQPHL